MLFAIAIAIAFFDRSVIRAAADKNSLPSWDHLTFTQFWPQAQCYYNQDTRGDVSNPAINSEFNDVNWKKIYFFILNLFNIFPLCWI